MKHHGLWYSCILNLTSIQEDALNLMEVLVFHMPLEHGLKFVFSRTFLSLDISLLRS